MIRFILLIITNFLLSQTSPQIGLTNNSIDVFSFNNATIHITPEQTLFNANLIIKDNKIYKVGEDVYVEGAIEIDCKEKHIYSGFIDLYHPIDVDTTLLISTTKHWNKRVHPEYVPNMDPTRANVRMGAMELRDTLLLYKIFIYEKIAIRDIREYAQ